MYIDVEVYFADCISFSLICHENEIVKVRKIKFKLDIKSLETIYITFIRPLLEFWDNI